MLFKTVDEIRKFCSAPNRNMSFDTWKPHIEFAQDQYLVPIISQAQLDELDEQYNSPTAADLTEDNARLLVYVQRSLAYYSLYEMEKELIRTVGDMGVQENQSKEGTSNPARQWVFNSTLQNDLQKADLLADRCLDFMEKNQDDYPLWQESDQYTLTKELFINKTAQFNFYVNIANSKRTFLAIKPYIEQCELEYIKPALGEEYFDDLKAKLLLPADDDGYFTAADLKILPMLRRALCNYALVKALPFMAVEIAGNGLTVVSSNDGITNKNSAYNTSRSAVENLVMQAQETASSFIQQMKIYLDDHIEDYPLYEDSDAYINPQPDTQLPDNYNSSTFMV